MGSVSLVVGPPLGSLRPRKLYHRPRPRPLLSLSRCSYSHPDASSHSIGKLEDLTTQVQKGSKDVPAEDQLESQLWMTGGAYDFRGATTSLTNELLSSSKKVTLVRHGLSSWNEESRVQGSSNLSILTDTGARQAEKCRNALADVNFDACFSSPISRAKSTAELIWHGREQPLVFVDSLKEAHLFFLEGMTNVDAKRKYPKLYTTWREDPANFNVDGIYPIRRLWVTAREAWKEILFTPGERFLVVTHKSILRALICTALGLGPERFRAIDVNNGGISTFTFNRRGEPMLQCLNMTAHMYSDHVYQY
ncbi:Phosphoserine phosphatase 1 [Cocos nucifera]|uniref:Phosphoserine phosphatase 1 n=1 Tax=Cocos nucifera TaxID=13894 RepID=A0A8K0I381_COCNU|nr:Phosphoserine phosphatase 1 [Cocos nucifera]